MKHNNYAEVSRLETPVLEGLLKTGDPQERVWAAWQIGLRVGSEAIPQLSDEANNAPDPGTRCHLIVILAGLQQYSILETLAVHDPDPSVRATSCQHLLGTAQENDIERYNLIQMILKDDSDAKVKQRILQHWSAHMPKISLYLLIECIANASVDVRAVATEHLMNQYVPNDIPVEQLIHFLANETNTELISKQSLWLLKYDEKDLALEAVLFASLPTKLKILDELISHGLKFQWP